MAGEDTSLDRSLCRLLALVPYESPSTHEYVIAISSAARYEIFFFSSHTVRGQPLSNAATAV